MNSKSPQRVNLKQQEVKYHIKSKVDTIRSGTGLQESIAKLNSSFLLDKKFKTNGEFSKLYQSSNYFRSTTPISKSTAVSLTPKKDQFTSHKDNSASPDSSYYKSYQDALLPTELLSQLSSCTRQKRKANHQTSDKLALQQSADQERNVSPKLAQVLSEISSLQTQKADLTQIVHQYKQKIQLTRYKIEFTKIESARIMNAHEQIVKMQRNYSPSMEGPTELTKHIETLNVEDLEILMVALNQRTKTEFTQISKLQDFISSIKKTIIQELKERDVMRKEVLVSRKKAQKVVGRLITLKKNTTETKQIVQESVNKIYTEMNRKSPDKTNTTFSIEQIRDQVSSWPQKAELQKNFGFSKKANSKQTESQFEVKFQV